MNEEYYGAEILEIRQVIYILFLSIINHKVNIFKIVVGCSSWYSN